MDRKEAAELLPFIQAFSEGRSIEFSSITDVSKAWREVVNFPIGMIKNLKFRIKPEPKCRPFKGAEECWNEMQKHQPFGWVNYNGYRVNIAAVMGPAITFVNNKGYTLFFQQAFEGCTFIDKQPFGIKVEE